MVRTIFFGLVFYVFVTDVIAQQTWTLKQCIEYAIAHNLTVKLREIEHRRQEVSLSTARNSRLPNLTASVSESFSFGRGLTADNTYVSHNTQSSTWGLNTSVSLFTGFRIPNQIAESRLNLQAAAQDLKKAREDVSLQVAAAYLQVLLDKDIWEVAKEQTKLSQLQQKRMEILLKEGKMAAVDVSQARSQTAQDRLSEVQAEQTYRLALLDLSQLLELPSPENFQIVSLQCVEPKTPNDSPEFIYRQAIQIKPHIKAEEFRLKGLEKNIRIAQAGFYPQLNFGAGLGSGYYKTSGIEARSFAHQMRDNFNKSLGFTLSIPIFNRLATRNSVRDARLLYENQVLQLESARKELYKEIQQAYYNAVAASEKYRSCVFAEAAANDAFELVTKKYEQGKATATEFNEAKVKRMKAISERIQSQYDGFLKLKILAFYKGDPIQ